MFVILFNFFKYLPLFNFNLKLNLNIFEENYLINIIFFTLIDLPETTL